MFCVECGREGPTIEGLCGSCTARKRTLVRPPVAIEVTECAYCGRLGVDGEWVRVGLDTAIPSLLRVQVPVDPRVTRPTFTHEATREDDRNYRLTVKFAGTLGDVGIVVPFQTRLRVKRGMCPTCSRKAGGYFEAIVQVRSTGRSLRADERNRVIAIAEGEVSEGHGEDAFVSRVEETEGGVDVYVSTGTRGQAAAKAVAAAFGGTVRTSPKLHGRKEGREVYRVTYRVRVPGYGRGDLLRFQGRLYGVREGGTDITVVDLEDWTSTTIRGRDLKRAEPIPARIDRYRVVRASESEIVLEREGNRVAIPRPPGWADAAEVSGIVVDGTVHIVPDL